MRSSIHGLIEIPAKVISQDVGIICIGAFLLCTLAALVPAFLAARTEPAVALRDLSGHLRKIEHELLKLKFNDA